MKNYFLGMKKIRNNVKHNLRGRAEILHFGTPFKFTNKFKTYAREAMNSFISA